MRAQVDNLAQAAGLRLNEARLDKAAWNRGSHENTPTRRTPPPSPAPSPPPSNPASGTWSASRPSPAASARPTSAATPATCRGPRDERDHRLGD